MVVKVKEKMRKSDMLKMMLNPKNIIYEDKEVEDIIVEFYLVQRNILL